MSDFYVRKSNASNDMFVTENVAFYLTYDYYITTRAYVFCLCFSHDLIQLCCDCLNTLLVLIIILSFLHDNNWA